MNFLGQGMNIFLGLLGVHVNLFLFNFPLCEYLFFCTSPALTPHKFSNGLSLQLLNEIKRATPWGILLTN